MVDTEKPTEKLHEVDLIPSPGNLVNTNLNPPQLLVFINKSEDSTSSLFNITLHDSQFHNNTVYPFSLIYRLV